MSQALALSPAAWARPWRSARRVVAVALIALGIFLGAAKIAQHRVVSQIAAPPGQLIDVGGRRLHIHCQGAADPGKPTLVFDAGLGESSLTWAGIAPALAETHHVCTYDRAGYGWSDPGPGAPSASVAIADLRTLLRAAGVPGPYVLVGHSLGGLYVRMYAYHHPEEIAGLVLLDPSHEEMTSRLPPDWQAHVRQTGEQAAENLRVPALLADQGFVALFPQLAPADPRLPPAAQATLLALSGAGGNALRALAQEVRASEALLAEGRTMQITDLGDVPLVVIKAGAAAPSAPPDGLTPFMPGYDLHRELAGQSSRGRLIVLASSTHYVHYDAPGAVIDAINTLVDSKALH